MILSGLKIPNSIHGDGNKVVEAYKAKNGNITLLLMDLHMPNCDGFEVINYLKLLQ